MSEVPQESRFGSIGEVPPLAVLTALGRGQGVVAWSSARMGGEGGFPNGGLWRFSTAEGDVPVATVVKRTGPQYLASIHR